MPPALSFLQGTSHETSAGRWRAGPPDTAGGPEAAPAETRTSWSWHKERSQRWNLQSFIQGLWGNGMYDLMHLNIILYLTCCFIK